MGINSNRVEHYLSSPEASPPLPASHHAATTTTNTSVCEHAMAMPPQEVHRVSLAPPRTTVQKLRHRLSEIFFPDDPLLRFKDQTWFRKLVLGLQFFFPVFQRMVVKSDVVSGLTIVSLAIPQGISYAKLANLPPIIGLYSSIVPPLIYSVLGSSRHLAVGPVSIATLFCTTSDLQDYSKLLSVF